MGFRDGDGAWQRLEETGDEVVLDIGDPDGLYSVLAVCSYHGGEQDITMSITHIIATVRELPVLHTGCGSIESGAIGISEAVTVRGLSDAYSVDLSHGPGHAYASPDPSDGIDHIEDPSVLWLGSDLGTHDLVATRDSDHPTGVPGVMDDMIIVRDVTLSDGRHEMVLDFDTDAVDLEPLEIDSVESSPAPVQFIEAMFVARHDTWAWIAPEFSGGGPWRFLVPSASARVAGDRLWLKASGELDDDTELQTIVLSDFGPAQDISDMVEPRLVDLGLVTSCDVDPRDWADTLNVTWSTREAADIYTLGFEAHTPVWGNPPVFVAITANAMPHDGRWTFPDISGADGGSEAILIPGGEGARVDVGAMRIEDGGDHAVASAIWYWLDQVMQVDQDVRIAPYLLGSGSHIHSSMVDTYHFEL